MLFLGPSVPLPLQTADNPTAPPRELWDAILAGSCEDRPAFVQASLPNVFSAHVGVGISPTQLNRFQLIVEAADGMAMERLVQIITATDFTDELGVLGSKYDLPVNIVHGDSDNGMPVEASAERVKKLISRAEINFYQKSDHGERERCWSHWWRFTDFSWLRYVSYAQGRMSCGYSGLGEQTLYFTLLQDEEECLNLYQIHLQ